jgi:hypothetical protein
MGLDTNEKQELNIHALFIKHKVHVFTLDNLPQEIKDHLGTGLFAIVRTMQEDGFVTNLGFNQKFEYNQTGRNRYELLRQKKRSDAITDWVLIATLVAAVVSAVYGILTYYATVSASNPPLPKPTTTTAPPKKDQSHPSIADTTRVRSQSDSSKKAKN